MFKKMLVSIALIVVIIPCTILLSACNKSDVTIHSVLGHWKFYSQTYKNANGENATITIDDELGDDVKVSDNLVFLFITNDTVEMVTTIDNHVKNYYIFDYEKSNENYIINNQTAMPGYTINVEFKIVKNKLKFEFNATNPTAQTELKITYLFDYGKPNFIPNEGEKDFFGQWKLQSLTISSYENQYEEVFVVGEIAPNNLLVTEDLINLSINKYLITVNTKLQSSPSINNQKFYYRQLDKDFEGRNAVFEARNIYDSHVGKMEFYLKNNAMNLIISSYDLDYYAYFTLVKV